jgi:drug/metabolite transporter (DMT)-like permease
MTFDGDNGRRGLGTLLRDLAEGSAAIVRGEAKLAKIEVTQIATGIAKGTAFVASGAVLSLLGALSALAGLVLLIGDQWLPADQYWLGALVVLLIAGVSAVVLLRRGMSLLSPSQLAPTETVTTLKEDKEWLKQRLTSGGTSS